MLLRPFLFLLIGVVCGSGIYGYVTRVRFHHQRGRVSSLYCKILGKQDILTKPVIFLPGIKGSLLVDERGQKKWIGLAQIARNTSPFLYRSEDQELEPIGIFTRLSFLPGLIEYAPYQRVSAFLACQPHSYFFSYDWRRNPMENVEKLGQLVTRTQQETGQKPSIIGHSMGGLIAYAYLQAHADRIDRAVFVGTPFQSGVGFLPDIDQGSSVGLNKTILSKEAIFSHPSSFALLPHAGQRLYKDLDLMEIDTWKKEMIGVFRDGTVDEEKFAQTLAEARAFHTIIDTPTSLSNPILFIVGNCQKTLKSIESDGTSTYADGDGRVLESAALPVGHEELNKQVVHSCAKHDAQLNDKQVIKKILNFLQTN